MSHVDEGLLHAYLDGAFPPGNAQGEEIDSHLQVCVDCRVRLEDARALKDRASIVLRHAAPLHVEVPPFETVRDRVGAAVPPPRKRTRPSWMPPLPLAWAATLVLALGAGWMANELFVGGLGPARRTAVSETSADAPQEAADQLRRRETAAAPLPASPPAASTPAGALADRVAPMRGRAATDADLSERERAQAARETDAGTPVTSQSAARKAAGTDSVALNRTGEAAGAGRRDGADTRADPRALAAPVPAAPAPAFRDAAQVLPGRDAEPFLAEARASGLVDLLNDEALATSTLAWTEVQGETAAALLGRELARIPGARPLGTEVARVAGRVLVRAAYALEDGTRVELVQRADPRPAADERRQLQARTGALPESGVLLAGQAANLLGEPVIWLRRDRMSVLLRGPLPADTLASVAARVR